MLLCFLTRACEKENADALPGSRALQSRRGGRWCSQSPQTGLRGGERNKLQFLPALKTPVYKLPISSGGSEAFSLSNRYHRYKETITLVDPKPMVDSVPMVVDPISMVDLLPKMNLIPMNVLCIGHQTISFDAGL